MPSIAEELDKLREANKRLEARVEEIERRLDLVFPARVRPQPPIKETRISPILTEGEL